MLQRITLFTTFRCNQRCRWCHTERWRPRADMSVELAEKVMDTFPEVQRWRLGGPGEPTVANGFVDIAHLALSRYKHVGVPTNGLRVVELRDEVPWRRFQGVQLSMNEIDVESYRATCGVDGFDRMLWGLDYLVAVGARVSVSFVVSPDNVDRIPYYFRLADEHKAMRVAFVLEMPLPGKTGITTADTAFVEALQAAKAECNGQHLKGVDWPLVPPPGGRRAPCAMSRDYLAVDGEGHVYPCHHWEVFGEYFGTVDEGPEVFHSSAIEEYRRRVGSDRRPLYCNFCAQREITAARR